MSLKCTSSGFHVYVNLLFVLQQFYKMTVYEDASDKFYSENQLTEQLLLILKDTGHNEPIGIITTEHRDDLANAYENLIEGMCFSQM